ncbi:MAG: polysaccharide biosynthesis tyrosine autokinase [Paraglaciecola sp.]|uniref:GumC family protein n=2 Tax=Paraglaciecola sp. TaxID=1920173 RepID=UPI00326555CA
MNEVVTQQVFRGSRMHENKTLDGEESVDLGHYWRAVRRAKWGILLVTLVSLLIGVMVARTAEPAFKATAKILADPQPPKANDDGRSISASLVLLFYQTQYEIINSRILAGIVVDKLGLVERFKQSDAYKDRDPSSKPMSDAELRIVMAAKIQDNLSVSGGRQSQIINISYVSSDPVQAAAIVNTLSEAYIQYGLESRLGELKNTELWLSEQSAQLKAALYASEVKLSQFRSQQGLVDTEQQQSLANSQLQSLNGELIRAQTRLSSAEEQYLLVKDVKVNSPELYSLGPVLQNAAASGLVIERARLEQRVNELFERYGEKHPKMIAARAELKSATEILAAEVNKIVENIEKDYQLAKVQVSNIEKLIDKSRNDIQELQSDNFSLVSLEREVENNRRIYENFQISLLEASGNSEYNASNITIIDSATVPLKPFKPNIKLIIMLSVITGLIVGIAMALLLDAFNKTFKTPDNIEDNLHLPTLGITPLVKKKKNIAKPEMQYLDDSLSPFSESVNTIRTGLLFSNIDKPPKTLLITSSEGGEGKSTLAINLAVAFSNIGKTLLLEVDLRKPSIAKCFDIPFNQGLTDLIMGASLEENVLHKINNEKLSIMPCGTIIRNPIELLSSRKFEEVLATLNEHFEYIVLDGPPTIPVSDACILANKVDGVIFVSKAEETKISIAKEAVSRLQKLNANVIGAVLTAADPKKMSYYGEHFHTAEYYGVTPKKGDEPKPEAAI